ncbi:SNF2 family amino-terminal protein [Trifolium pratense]|uniref:SNF2 family amino-terminal protein n=1 Tax=Trifolium pratense TaxID=57577 RepID=A0A2K3N5M2_TRIPR|nr:SNF2 family amino-terminal protein [Trifolium pratense]
MAYLKVFPECFPVIIAPAGLLLTWEDEFKKWNIGVPFHNLNNPELSGKEHDDAVNAFNWSTAQHSKVDTRMVKLISWYKETSILGISYTLYKKLAGAVESEDEGGESENERTKNQASVEKRKEMGKFLRKVPGLLVLDEGHTPRNKRSGIWKVFSEIPTKKRIILSGTPFQNNCLELYNTLSLVKPSFPNMLPLELKKFCQKQQKKKASKELRWEQVCANSTTENPSDDNIQKLKLLMDPLVHVHKGAILQKKLPGLRNCVLRLKPDGFHKQILESFESSQNSLIFENNQTLVSIHPSLFLECTLSEQEKSAVDKDRLEKLRLNHNAGIKTRFLVEFVSLCAAVNEKVLVFSQFLRPLHLIIDHLKSALNWTEDEEILYMDGRVKDRQSLIHRFNDADSQAKILLASTKACSEGISLVGASRVVLLDVEWNPSVEKQAISRAYRIGQTKFVYIYHLLTQGTRECDKYCKQIEKHRLSELIFSAKNADNNDESKSRATNVEDTILDKMIRHENLKDLFDDCVIQPLLPLWSHLTRPSPVMLRSEAVLASSASELFVALARDPCVLHLWLEKDDGLFEKCCNQLLDIKYWHFEELECFCYVITFSASRAFELLVTLARDPLVAYHRLE